VLRPRRSPDLRTSASLLDIAAGYDQLARERSAPANVRTRTYQRLALTTQDRAGRVKPRSRWTRFFSALVPQRCAAFCFQRLRWWTFPGPARPSNRQVTGPTHVWRADMLSSSRICDVISSLPVTSYNANPMTVTSSSRRLRWAKTHCGFLHPSLAHHGSVGRITLNESTLVCPALAFDPTWTHCPSRVEGSPCCREARFG